MSLDNSSRFLSVIDAYRRPETPSRSHTGPLQRLVQGRMNKNTHDPARLAGLSTHALNFDADAYRRLALRDSPVLSGENKASRILSTNSLPAPASLPMSWVQKVSASFQRVSRTAVSPMVTSEPGQGKSAHTFQEPFRLNKRSQVPRGFLPEFDFQRPHKPQELEQSLRPESVIPPFNHDRRSFAHLTSSIDRNNDHPPKLHDWWIQTAADDDPEVEFGDIFSWNKVPRSVSPPNSSALQINPVRVDDTFSNLGPSPSTSSDCGSGDFESHFMQDSLYLSSVSSRHPSSHILRIDSQAVRIDEVFWYLMITDSCSVNADAKCDDSAIHCNVIVSQDADELCDIIHTQNNLFHTIHQDGAPPLALASASIVLPGTDVGTDVFERTSTARAKISPAVSSPSSSFSPSWECPPLAKDLDDQGRTSFPPSMSTHNVDTSYGFTASSSSDTVDTFESFINAARSIPHWPTPPSPNDLEATMRNPQLFHLQDPLSQPISSILSHTCSSILPPTPSSLTRHSSNSSRGSALILGGSPPVLAFPPTSLCFPRGPLIAATDPYPRGSPRILPPHEQQPKHREVPLHGILPSPPLTDSPLSTVSVFQSTPHYIHPMSTSISSHLPSTKEDREHDGEEHHVQLCIVQADSKTSYSVDLSSELEPWTSSVTILVSQFRSVLITSTPLPPVISGSGSESGIDDSTAALKSALVNFLHQYGQVVIDLDPRRTPPSGWGTSNDNSDRDLVGMLGETPLLMVSVCIALGGISASLGLWSEKNCDHDDVMCRLDVPMPVTLEGIRMLLSS